MTHMDTIIHLCIGMMITGFLIWGVDQSSLPEPAKGWAKAGFVLSVALVFLRKFGFV